VTARASAGRPLSAIRAKKRFGLFERPAYREKIAIPPNTKVRYGRALNGERGVGETRIEKGLPNTAIIGVTKSR
jgi:hypothetical protein